MTWRPPWLEEAVVCPYDGQRLSWSENTTACARGHRLPVVHGIPIALRDDSPSIHHLWRTTAADVDRWSTEREAANPPPPGVVDPFVARRLVATCGNLYEGLPRPLPRYPIPDLALPDGDGRLLLDIGANWGRWSLAAARRGYKVIAVDSSLDAALAGSRIARQLQLPVAFVVGDARHLPFHDGCFDFVFSYSVLQHLDKAFVREILAEIRRVSRPQGRVRVQIANVLGIKRFLSHSAGTVRRIANRLLGRSRSQYGFRIRAWTPREVASTFSSILGPSSISADGFLSLNAQASDIDLLTPGRQSIVRVSRLLCRLSKAVPMLTTVADSLMVDSIVEKTELRSAIF